MSKKLFRYFSVRELVHNYSLSDFSLCLCNGYMDNLLYLLSILDDFRSFINNPIVITSSFRSTEKNKLVGGSPTSQHLVGEAIDFAVPGMFFDCVKYLFIDFINKNYKNDVGQVIFYTDKCFIHISLSSNKFKSFTYYEKRKNQDNY